MNDWTTDAADAIERSVATLRDYTVEPARHATRAAVYGTLAVLIAIPAVVMLLVGLFRVLVVVEQGYVWAAWCTLGGILVAVGAFLWAKRNR